jgi:hypothetical protein
MCLTNRVFDGPGNINEFDAIIFHPFLFNKHTEIPNQGERKPNQRYVMYLEESPLMDYMEHSHFNNFFNWTITYRSYEKEN